MQSYQLDLLDEKALVILRGLEQLRIITLRPLNTGNDEKKVNDYDSTEQQHDIVQEPMKGGWKALKGTVTSPTTEDVEAYLKEIRDDWK